MDVPGYKPLFEDLHVRNPFFAALQQWMTAQWKEKKRKREEEVKGGNVLNSAHYLDWQYLSSNSRSPTSFPLPPLSVALV